MKSDDLKVMCKLLVIALIIALLLIVSGNVELNPGTIKKCPKCEKMMPITRTLDLIIVNVVICYGYAMLPRGFYTLVYSFCFVSIATNVNFLLTHTVYYIHVYSIHASISEHKFK